MTNAVNLSEEVQNEILGKYKTAVSRAGGFAKSLVNELGQKSQKYQYAPYMNAVNRFIGFYNDTLPGIIEGGIHKWKESDASIRRLLEIVENDTDDALSEANSFENKLYETAKELFSGNKLEKLTHSTAHGNYSIFEIQEDVDVINRYCDEIEELKTEAQAEFATGAETNAVYSSISGMVTLTLNDVVAQFKETQEMFKLLLQGMNRNINQVNTAGIGFADEAKKTESTVTGSFERKILKRG